VHAISQSPRGEKGRKVEGNLLCNDRTIVVIGFRLYGMERGIDADMIENKINHYASRVGRWFQKKQIVRRFAGAVLMKVSRSKFISAGWDPPPAVRVAVGGGVCPGKRGGVLRTRIEARRGLNTATV
jgi:hypothetical protein